MSTPMEENRAALLLVLFALPDRPDRHFFKPPGEEEAVDAATGVEAEAPSRGRRGAEPFSDDFTGRSECSRLGEDGPSRGQAEAEGTLPVTNAVRSGKQGARSDHVGFGAGGGGFHGAGGGGFGGAACGGFYGTGGGGNRDWGGLDGAAGFMHDNRRIEFLLESPRKGRDEGGGRPATEEGRDHGDGNPSTEAPVAGENNDKVAQVTCSSEALTHGLGMSIGDTENSYCTESHVPRKVALIGAELAVVSDQSTSMADDVRCVCGAQVQPPCSGDDGYTTQPNLLDIDSAEAQHFSLGHGLKASTRDSQKKSESSDISLSKPAEPLGAEHIGPYDPAYEILLCGGQVLSHWRQIWVSSPLVLCDKNILRCLYPKRELYDLTVVISTILANHPGPVAYFRIECSKWTGGAAQLSKWLKTLSEKDVSEVVIVNRNDLTSLEFPLQEIQSKCLKALRLGFFKLSQLDHDCFDYKQLDTLQLLGCSFDTSRLSQVVNDCYNLSHLEIGLSVGDLKIHSTSLKYMQIWRCSMRRFSIESAPKLNKLVIGVQAREKFVQITVSDTPVLQEWEYLLLPLHIVEDKSWMKGLKRLGLGVEMASSSQRILFCECIQYASNLQCLYLWRMDEIDPAEELDVVVDNSLLMLNTGVLSLNNLQILQIEDFRGGGSEIAIVSAILKYAVHLRSVGIHSYHSSEDLVRKAVLELRSREKASANCSLSTLS